MHCAFFYKGDTYIVMSRIKGQMVWPNRSQEPKMRILAQLLRTPDGS